MSDQKTSLVEAPVGSEEWARLIQEFILESDSVCFSCGDLMTFKSGLFYLTGVMGTVMIHKDCFEQPKAKPPRKYKVVPDSEGGLPPGEWATIPEVARFAGLSYMAIYQRIVAGTMTGVKHEGQWLVSKNDMNRIGKGKLPLGRRPAQNRKMWRSDVTEPVDRMLASQVARLLGVSRTWVLQRKNQFGGVKIMGVWYFSTELVNAYLRRSEEQEDASVG